MPGRADVEAAAVVFAGALASPGRADAEAAAEGDDSRLDASGRALLSTLEQLVNAAPATTTARKRQLELPAMAAM